MAKVNRKGRSNYEPYIKLNRGVTKSLAWQNLKCEARALMIEIWARHNGSNNGQIGYSHRQARVALGVGNRKVQGAFKELQDKGFIVARYKGHFDWKLAAGQGRASEWELTTEACDGNPPKGTFRKWKEK